MTSTPDAANATVLISNIDDECAANSTLLITHADGTDVPPAVTR